MSNEYYDHGSYPATGAPGSSAGLRAELESIEAGFNKLPVLSGNGGKLVKVKADGSGMEAVGVTAADVTNTPSGSISATTVQAAINELDSEKAAATHSHAQSDVTGLSAALSGKSDTGHTHTGTYEPANATILKSANIGSTVQAYDADTAKTDVEQTWTADQTLGAGRSLIFEGTNDDANEGALTATAITADRTWTMPDKSGTVAMTSDITSGVTLATPVASTSGTAIDFTSIPAGTKKITVSFIGVSTNGTSIPQIQIGDSGGVETSGYTAIAASHINAGGANITTSTAGFVLRGFAAAAANTIHGSVELNLENSTNNTWAFFGVIHNSTATIDISYISGTKSLSAALDRVRVTTANGTDSFDAGEINISYM